MKSLVASSWNVPDSIGVTKDIPELDLKVLICLTIGPFIRGKIRRELYHLYEHVLSKTRAARINGSRLISVLDWFSCECCP